MDTTTPAAGWYTDPQAPQQLRYWDGAAWTAHVSPAPTAAPPQQTAYAAATPSAPRSGRGMSAGAIVGIVIGVIVAVFVVLAAISIPIFVNQRNKAQDALAQGAAIELGIEIVNLMVDDPYLDVSGMTESADGAVTLGAANASDWSYTLPEGVSLGGTTRHGPTELCIWVESETGHHFKFDVEVGPGEGRC